MALSHAPLPDGLSPGKAFGRLRGLPGALILESTDRDHASGRHSFVAADPFAVLSANGRGTTVEWAGGPRDDDPRPPLAVLRELLGRFRVAPGAVPDGVPFPGGAAGWLGYELGGTLEPLPRPRGHDPKAPLLELGLYDVVLGWDHDSGGGWIVSTGFPETAPEARARRARARMEAVLERLSSAAPGPGGADPDGRPEERRSHPALHPVSGLPGVSSTFSSEGYEEAVERIRHLIRRGDLFQANLSQRFQTDFSGDPFRLHRRLARSHPAPYAACLETGDGAVVSASPESFLRVRGRRAETRPIKGTASRSADPEKDAELARGLLRSEKDRAENIMIVDLLRNDLSRVCEPGSVRASALCALESHPTVHHLVSVVEGRLAEGRGPVDLLEATFPGGSITGAPKLRAIEVLAELEPTPRGVYTGSVGWLGFDGEMELSIAIRTIRIRDGKAYVQAGGGVVLDSDPEAERMEAMDKVRGLLRALEGEEDEKRRGEGPLRRPGVTSVGAELPAEEVPDREIGAPMVSRRPGVAVLDHRDSFVHNLARYLRELGAGVRVFRADRASLEELEGMDPTHLVLSPGPCTPREFPLAREAIRAFAGRIPILGVCLGHLCIAEALGGGWSGAERPLHGKASAIHHDGTGLFRGLSDPFPGARYHSLSLSPEDVPEGFRVVARSDRDEVMAMEDGARRIWGLQFHPESVLTPQGRKLLLNFLEEAVEPEPVVAASSSGSAR